MSIPATANADQQAFFSAFQNFLLDPLEREYRLSGAGGTGKTWSMQHIINHVFPNYIGTCETLGLDPIYDQVALTATTNKAAEALYQEARLPTQTIHSLLGLKVRPDTRSKSETLELKRDAEIVQKKLIVVDESSMLCRDGLRFLRDRTLNCKILFVGDRFQLQPVNHNTSPVYSGPGPTSELFISERNKNAPALQALCQQLRDTITDLENGVPAEQAFKPIQLVPGEIDWFDDAKMDQEFIKQFSMPSGANPVDHRIVAYSNARVRQFNEYIRTLRNLPPEFTAGETLVNNRVVERPDLQIPTDKPVTIVSASAVKQASLPYDCVLDVQDVELMIGNSTTIHRLQVPIDGDHLQQCIKYIGKMCAQDKDFSAYHTVRAIYPDLRQRDALTSHKAQGSSFDVVFVDLGNLSTCYQPETFARLFYVALSRARQRVIFYGNLAPRYGRLIN